MTALALLTGTSLLEPVLLSALSLQPGSLRGGFSCSLNRAAFALCSITRTTITSNAFHLTRLSSRPLVTVHSQHSSTGGTCQVSFLLAAKTLVSQKVSSCVPSANSSENVRGSFLPVVLQLFPNNQPL